MRRKKSSLWWLIMVGIFIFAVTSPEITWLLAITILLVSVSILYWRYGLQKSKPKQKQKQKQKHTSSDRDSLGAWLSDPDVNDDDDDDDDDDDSFLEPETSPKKRRTSGSNLSKIDKYKVWVRQNAVCYCGYSFPFKNFTGDHIIPVAKGGSRDPDNHQLLCNSCNSTKGTATMTELRERLLKRSKRSPWWSGGFHPNPVSKGFKFRDIPLLVDKI